MTLLLTLVASVGVAAAETYCSAPPHLAEGSTDQQELAALAGDIRTVLGAYPGLAEAFDAGAPNLCLSHQMDNALAFLEVERNRIVLRRDLPQAMKMGVLLHELRHLWQVRQGQCPSDALSMKEHARATFALEADASAVSLLIAWDLKQDGQPAIWEALSSWRTQSDIAASVGEVMAETGDRRLAASAAFRQWYSAPERMRSYYVASCSAYLDRQDANHALPRYAKLPDSFFASLCRLPDGEGYPCADPRATPE